MRYKEEIVRAMEWRGEQPSSLFIGQAVTNPGHAMSSTLTNIPLEKKIELPVFEETQTGMAIGLALEGYKVVSCYPRFDFFILGLNQLVNHLDKIREMSFNTFTPKVILRVGVGAKRPVDAGPQHTQNHTQALKLMLTDTEVVELLEPSQIFDAYIEAFSTPKSYLFVEHIEYYSSK